MNEATVRVLYANAIVYMISTLNNYYFRVEHRFISDDNDSSTELSQGISVNSVADYVCYSVHEGKKLVTVVLETKQKFNINALAQLLGYYFRAVTSYKTIGVSLLLTKQSLHCILCPFGDEYGTLVNALCVKEIKLKDSYSLLYLLAILTSSCFAAQPLICLEERFLPLRKGLQFFVECEQTKNFEDTVKYLKARLKELDKEVAELKCRYLPVQVKVTRQEFFS